MNMKIIKHRGLCMMAVLSMVCLLPAAGAQTGVQSGIARVNGTELYYEMAGSGHPLVLIHGGGVDSRAWDDQFPVFAEHFQVIRFDLRGSGKSGHVLVPFSNAEDIKGLLDHLGIRQAHFIGISRGGGFSFDFALEHPARVSALVLVSANMGVDVPEYGEMHDRMDEAGRRDGAAAAAKIWATDPHQGPVRESAKPVVLRLMTENLAKFRYFEGYKPVKDLPAPGLPRAQRLAEIHVPTLVISGARDAGVARANSRNWAKGIAGARLVVFPDAAHLVMIDQPEEFNRTVLEFLKGLGSSD
jgi:pimeloyl-ACP methyl ester carboxylesterase